jgi:release factor glutamine methyltransferase
MAQPASTAIREALNSAAALLGDAGITTARMDAQTLLMHAIGCDRAFLLANPEHEISAQQFAHWTSYIQRRARSEPIQYITGLAEFYGLPLQVDRSVLIPRPETEHLVEALLARIATTEAVNIVDVGTGSGAIAIAVAKQLPHARLTALDLSQPALEIAQANAVRNGVAGRVEFRCSDLLSEVLGEKFDAIVSNPPYVPSVDRESLEKQVREYEPAMALFAGTTGFEIYEHLIVQAAAVLKPGGWLLMEIGFGQKAQIAELLSDWCDVSFENDLQNIPRVACARHR